jgi:hypothetical protein
MTEKKQWLKVVARWVGIGFVVVFVIPTALGFLIIRHRQIATPMKEPPLMRSIPTLSVVAGTCIVAAHLLVPRTMFAQIEPGSCSRIAGALAAGSTRLSDIPQLVQCPASGPATLAELWTRELTTPADLETLVQTSATLRDARLYDVVFGVARSSRQATAVRLGALRVLIEYYNPELSPSETWLRSATLGDPIPVRMHHAEVSGASPVPPSLVTDIPPLMADLAHSDDPAVAGAALPFRQSLASDDPEHTPVQPDAVRLIAKCGNSVMLQSTLDVTLRLRVQVLGSSFEKTISPRAWSGGRPMEIPMLLPPGTVVVSYGSGHELARLTRRNAACPQ